MPNSVIFHSSSKKIDHNLKFKLDGKCLTSTSTVKYLGVLLDNHLLWSKQINHVITKLNQTIGILSTLRNNTSLKTLKMTNHSLFSSHLLLGPQLWGHTNLTNQNKIQKLQNSAPRNILFKKQENTIRHYYKELQILKFPDLLYLHSCLFMSQIETNQKLANSFADLKHCSDSHNYQTKSKTKGIIDIPLLNTQIYGTQSVKYNCIKDWNFFSQFSQFTFHTNVPIS